MCTLRAHFSQVHDAQEGGGRCVTWGLGADRAIPRGARCAMRRGGDSPISQGDKKTSAFFLGLVCALWSKFVRELPCLPGGRLGEGHRS